MTFFTILYNLIIGPLELLFEVVYTLAYRVSNNPTLSIVFLSLAVNFLSLPLYRRADAVQTAVRDKEKEMQPWVKRIKKAFSGDEQYMMLQTYYRQNDYRPTDTLKGSISLFLQVPFFMAAYRFLSNLEMLNGVRFGPITDLGSPDKLLVIAGITINVLPILMTIINFISGAIYTKGFPVKNKIQLYGIAILFLVLLYKSPSGLVFYWILNNIFSLVKNVFYKLKNSKLTLCVLFSVISIVMIVYLCFNPMDTNRHQIIVLLLLIMLQLPLLLYFALPKIKIKRLMFCKDNKVFYLGCIATSLLIGLFVPIRTLASSPSEFVDTSTQINPLIYILNSTIMAIGIFVVWMSVFYALSNNKGKAIMEYLVLSFFGVAFLNYAFFGKELGDLSNQLVFEIVPYFPARKQLINLAICILVVLVLYFIWNKYKTVVKVFYVVVISFLLVISVKNVIYSQKEISISNEKVRVNSNSEVTIQLSSTEQNVVVIMLDRAISAYVPYLFAENSELLNQFDGFTFYPNTASYGCVTNIAAPAVFGGYEYTPLKINERSNESLASKHDEALKLMPVMFGQEGYDVTVIDPPYAGYSQVSDLSIYDDYSYIKAYTTEGKFDSSSITEDKVDLSVLYRNFLCFSIFRTAPMVLQSLLYDDGIYNEADSVAMIKNGTVNSELISRSMSSQVTTSLSTAMGYSKNFIKNYAVLSNLTNITSNNNTNGSLVLLTNNITHNCALLQEPEYEPSAIVDNTKYDLENNVRYSLDGVNQITFTTSEQVKCYQTEMAAFIQLGKWFDYLKENGMYDNTRIIIVSDHGWTLGQFSSLFFGDIVYDVMLYNPLLLVKDFNESGFKTDDTFMTNADVPSLAVKGLLSNTVNPFTNKDILIGSSEKELVIISKSDDHDIDTNNGNVFNKSTWCSVHDNIFDISNWKIEN